MSVNFDHTRTDRTGIPEVILAGPKRLIDLEEAIRASIDHHDRILITRIRDTQIEMIEELVVELEFQVTWDRYHRTAIAGILPKMQKDPAVAILSGGTSDQPIVEEIKLSLQFFNLRAITFPDVGVAGIHRHQKAMQEIEAHPSVKILIVVAGNEGALFSVISGQTKLPMIAVPAGVGYGLGGKGKTALYSALQSCSPGVVAVNIDNGFGAATFAKKMMNQY